jgi:type II secretory pathway pseudopilin PulG
MKTFKQLVNWIRDSKGVATSLIEATATIGVGAVLATVAIGAGVNAINDAKVQTAAEDVRQIGQGIFSFYSDNNIYPMFVNGHASGPNDAFYHQLVSANGSYPATNSSANGGGSNTIAASWGIPATTSASQYPAGGAFTGDSLFSNQDSIEDQLVLNELGFAVLGTLDSTKDYPLRGSYAADPNRGYHGPYVQNLPATDPWGDKYVVNIQALSPQYLNTYTQAHQTSNSTPGIISVAVFVCSAGENKVLETNGEQPASTAAVFGDDICFRVK